MTYSVCFFPEKKRYYIALLVVLILLIFYPLLTAGVIGFDDTTDLFRLINPGTSPTLKEIFRHKGILEYFRPLLMLSFVLDAKIWAFEYSGYHLTNNLIHVVNAVLVYRIFYHLFQSEPHVKWVSLGVSLLFALHPLVCESVAWISGRSDIMGTLFSLLAFSAYLSTRTNKYFSVVIWVLAGLLSKENSLAIIPIILFTELIHKSETITLQKRLFACFKLSFILAIPFSAYLYLKLYGFNLPVPFEITLDPPKIKALSASVGTPFYQTGLSVFAVCGFYIKKLFIPWPLNFAIFSINQPLYSVFFLLIVVMAMVLIYKKKYTAPIWLCFIIISFFPSIPVIFTDVAWTHYAERYLYLSVAVWAIGVGSVYFSVSQRFPIMKKAIVIGLICVIFCFGLMTFLRVLVWGDNVSLWADTLTKNPYNGKVLYKYGEAIGGDDAIPFFKRAVERGMDKDWKDFSLLKLAQDAKKKNQNNKAFEFIDKALSIEQKPRLFLENCRVALGILSGMNGLSKQEKEQIARAKITCWQKMFRIDHKPNQLFKIANLYLNLGENEKAGEFFGQLIRQFPNSASSRQAGKALEMMGTRVEAPE